MIWTCFTGERLHPLIIYDEGDIGADEYEDLIYDSLFSLVDNHIEPLDNSETIHIADKNTFLFMQDNAPCHKADPVLQFLHENPTSIMKWPP